MTPHQIDMIKAVMNVPDGVAFTAGDMAKKYGYPHKDASRVLQQIITWQAIGYAEPCVLKGKIQYERRKSIDYIQSFYERAKERYSR